MPPQTELSASSSTNQMERGNQARQAYAFSRPVSPMCRSTHLTRLQNSCSVIDFHLSLWIQTDTAINGSIPCLSRCKMKHECMVPSSLQVACQMLTSISIDVFAHTIACTDQQCTCHWCHSSILGSSSASRCAGSFTTTINCHKASLHSWLRQHCQGK